MAYTLTPAPGTISISGAVITGVGTTFTAYKMGAEIFVKGIGIVGQLASDPTSNLSATLVNAWTGTAVAGAVFEVYAQNDPAVYAARVRALLNSLAVPKTGQNMVFDGSSITAGDPGAGKVRFNSATNPTIAWISYTDSDGNNITSLVEAIDDVLNANSRSSLTFRPTDGANAFVDLNVTGALTDDTTYAAVPVSLRAGTVPVNGAALAMASVPSGADGASPSASSQQADNLGFAIPTFSAGAMTIALKQKDGATDPATGAAAVNVGMRSATSGSGAFNQRSVTAALSLVAPSGATFGGSSGIAQNLYLYLQDNAGALELAASGTDFGESFIGSSTTISSGATSAAVIYAGTGRANVAMRKVGMLTSTQTTAGIWAAAAAPVQVLPFGGAQSEFFRSLKTAANAAAARATLGAVSIAGDTMTGDLGLVSLNSGPLAGFRNAVINPGPNLWQRGTSIAIAATTSTYTCDRWAVTQGSGTVALTVAQQSAPATGVPYSQRVQRNSANTNTGAIHDTQVIETINCIGLQGKTVTLSFYAKAGANYSAASGTFVSRIITGTGADEGLASMLAGTWTGQATTSTQNNTLTTTRQRFTQTLTIPAGAGEIAVDLQATPVGTAGANDWFEVDSIQLEPGSIATPLERRPYSVELDLCLPYLWVLKQRLVAFLGCLLISGSALAQVQFPKKMRAAPTAVFFATGYGTGAGQTGVFSAGSNLTASSLSLTFDRQSVDGGTFTVGNLTSGTTGQACSIDMRSDIWFSAEL